MQQPMSDPLTFISLFAGIGGLDLGLERAGMQCVAQVEIDDYAQRVLAKHWPAVPRFRDVRTVGAHNLPHADLICGGFPCQDISEAGSGVGLAGERSGLWFEFARIIRELRPRYVLVENVSALTWRGLDIVLGDLSALRYDAEWSIVSACALGAPHTRERLFILAHAAEEHGHRGRDGKRGRASVARGTPAERREDTSQAERLCSIAGWWTSEPGMGRMAYGVPRRMDRLGVLGNAVVPQVAEFIGRAIVAHAQEVSNAA